MVKPNGVHHLALATSDMKAQLTFFTQVLGMELMALFWMHGAKGAWHSFLRLNDQCYLSFVSSPRISRIKAELGVSHAANAGAFCAGGTMQHLALRVANQDDLLAMRDRIRSHGVPVFGELDHGMCKSIYFAGPEGINLEIACAGLLQAEAWIDPEVVAASGISAQELEQMTTPPAYERPAASVAQPCYDPTKPHLRYPEEVYKRMLLQTDESMTAQNSVPQPPVALATRVRT